MIGAAKAIISDSVVSSFTMFVSPTALFKFAPSGSDTTGIAEAYPSNGVAPYTYSWTQISGDAITINSPTSKSTTFSASGSGGDKTGIFQCEVTDNTLATRTDTVEVTFLFT